MSAQILVFTGVQHVRQQATTPDVPSFRPGEAVEIHSYDWLRGDEFFRATVIRQTGEWVACRVPGHGEFSVHASRLERPAPEAA